MERGRDGTMKEQRQPVARSGLFSVGITGTRFALSRGMNHHEAIGNSPTKRPLAILAMVFATVTGAAACRAGNSGGPWNNAPLDPEGASCETDADCASGICIVGERRAPFCSRTCESSSDCVHEDYKCGASLARSNVCLPGCGGFFGAPRVGFSCVDGVPTSCGLLDDTHCASCGCPAEKYCRADVGCFNYSEVGEPCVGDQDCVSKNCSKHFGICRVPVGDACTSEDCDRCVQDNGGASYCSRECASSDECNGGACLGRSDFSGGRGFYTCYARCYGSCSLGNCVLTSDFALRFCECPECDVVQPPLPLAARCRFDGECASGDCHGFGFCLDGCDDAFCSATCTSSADCGEGLYCADVPCAAGETGTCGMKCLPRCDSTSCEIGTCRSLPSAEAEPVQVCETKIPSGAIGCSVPSDCFSGQCRSGQCE
jgi:hypothetical protein